MKVPFWGGRIAPFDAVVYLLTPEPAASPLGRGSRVERRRPKEKKLEAQGSTHVTSTRSPLSACLVALSLIVQLFVVPYHQALAAPGMRQAERARIAADLKARFGDAATLCVQIDDKGAPQSPAGHRDDQCPLCQFGAQAAALVAPEVAALPLRLDAACRIVRAGPEPGAVPARPAQQNLARAPPLAV
jgi:hypothetical protein